MAAFAKTYILPTHPPNCFQNGAVFLVITYVSLVFGLVSVKLCHVINKKLITLFNQGKTLSSHRLRNLWPSLMHCKLYELFGSGNKFYFWLRYINKWNDLPENLVHFNSVSKFKKGLKNYLYNVTQ